MSNNNFDYIETELYKIPLFGKKVGLLNIEKIMLALDEKINILSFLDQATLIHVTGTNGKGSVARMLSGIYSAAGYKVGLFTSPHISSINERIRFNNENVSKELFLNAYKVVKAIVENLESQGLSPTFFEWIFAMGLYCFGLVKPDIIIIEVGIGGRLDTTNIIPKKDLCVITPIGLDHQDILGNTIEEIARDKAGIIKEGNKVVFYNKDPKAEKVIDGVMSQREDEYYKVLPKSLKILETGHFGIDFSIDNKYYYYENLRLPTLVDYQLENVAIALTCIHALKEERPIELEHIQSGLKDFKWPGRFEEIKKGLIIDGAHNRMGMEMLLSSVNKHYKDVKPDLLLSVKEGKNVNDIIDVIIKYNSFHNYYIADMTIQQSFPKEVIKEKLGQYANCVTLVDNLEAFLTTYNYSADKVLIGAGSLYFISEIRNIILNES